MAGIFKYSDQESKIAIITVLRTLMEKVNNVQGQIGKVSREMENLRKNQK